MKINRFIVGIVCLFVSSLTVYAVALNFNFDSSTLSFSANNKKSSIVSKFDNQYNLTYGLSNENIQLEEQIKDLTKKVTYLLLGDFNNELESNENYYKRKKDFFDMAAYKYYPKDSSSKSGYDETKYVYTYVVASEIAIPQMFSNFNDLNILYNSYGNIRVTFNDDLVISTLTLPDVKMKEEDKENPFNYNVVKTNLVIHYYFIKIDGTYRLTYLYGETNDKINKYFDELANNETKTSMGLITSYKSELANIYNFDKLEEMTEDQFNDIYNKNLQNIVYLRSYYNNKVIANANGVFINDGIVLTTWSFVEKSLINAQYITIKDNLGKTYNMDGLITANPNTDVVVIKLKEKSGSSVLLGDNESIKVENPAVVLSSKYGVGLITQKGIIIANDRYIQSSIPLTESDEGSPLFNKDGQMIGLNTSKSINSSVSMAINISVIKEIQDKFNSIDFNTIQTITFEQLKNEYYYTKYNKEKVINNISKNKWNKYKKVGNIEEKIKLELVKASYQDKIVSLRYKNNISNYVSSMMLSSSFREQLMKDGYKEILNSSSKCIYEDGNYKVIIMDEFDYLIVVMVKL